MALFLTFFRMSFCFTYHFRYTYFRNFVAEFVSKRYFLCEFEEEERHKSMVRMVNVNFKEIKSSGLV